MNNQSDEATPYLVLEIAHGQTAHRLRPVHCKRYLIGSGVNCNLRIGEEGFPPLHSIILNGPEGPEIELVSSHDELIINGKSCEHTVLKQDDQIQIGKITLVVHQQELNGVIMDHSHTPESHNETDQEQAHIVPFPAKDSIHEEEMIDQDLSELSAEELVDLIQEEENLITEFEKGIEAGYQALLHEAGITEDQIKIPTKSVSTEKDLSLLQSQLTHILSTPIREESSQKTSREHELNQIALQLSEFAEELEQRSISLTQREIEYSKASEELLESQKTLCEQLDFLLNKADELNEAEEQKHSRRASA